MAKVEIAHDEQFLLWPKCFQLYLTIKVSFMKMFQVLLAYFQSRLLQIGCMWELVKYAAFIYYLHRVLLDETKGLPENIGRHHVTYTSNDIGINTLNVSSFD